MKSEEQGKKIYDAPQLTVYGKFTEVVQQGGGKLSILGGDPGEGRKQQGGGG